MRGSICLLGPLLAVCGAARLPLPGGCVIGKRPINLHLKGLSALGADARIEVPNIEAVLRPPMKRLRGNRVDMMGPRGSTVLGTANVLMAAVLAEGETVIENAAREPEVQDLCTFLSSAGACISGAGTNTLRICGVDRLAPVEHALIPDRIEAGTYAVAAALTGGSIALEGARREHLEAVIDVMEAAGVTVEQRRGALIVSRDGPIRPVSFETAPYPGFPTDMQPQMLTMLSLAEGRSMVTEAVYPDRFTHVADLDAMGARIARHGPHAMIEGVAGLSGAHVKAADLRGGAALVLAGMVAEGVTTIEGIDQIDRGYENLEGNLSLLGASIRRVAGEVAEPQRRKSA
jgi:UDP-N-acetylglucosamine 1-carboxyvinyltransferase